ncbi:MAG: TIGR03617 family F420-dependent LLM class oxidoreductase [Acidimicrobiales bacterium]
MRFDIMTSGSSWATKQDLARTVEAAGFSGMVFTETSQVPWMQIAAAALAAPTLEFSTGIAVAFPRSPMVSAAVSWELAENTEGRFRLGLGSQVRAHIERRYATEFESPGPRLKDYLLAVKAVHRAFRREEKLSYEGDFYQLTLLPTQWMPAHHEFDDIKIDVSAVGPWMTRMAGEVADGIHVHPLHSMHYIENRLAAGVAEGAGRVGRSPSEIDLIIPVFAVAGDTPEERAPLLATARQQIAFYGSTKNYGFQFDDLGFEGTSALLNQHLKSGDLQAMVDTISEEMLEQFAVIGSWDDIAAQLCDRYQGAAARLVMYLTEGALQRRPEDIAKWGEVARAVIGGTSND